MNHKVEKAIEGAIPYFLVLAIVVFVSLAMYFGKSDAGTLRFGAGKIPAHVNYISTELTSTGQAVTGTCAFKSIVVKTDGTNNVTVSAYAGTDNTGTRLIPYQTVVLGNSYIFMIEYGQPIEALNGVYVEITTVGTARVQVVYDQG